MIYIIDLKNNKLNLMEFKKFLDILTSIIKNNYPEILLKYTKIHYKKTLVCGDFRYCLQRGNLFYI